MTCRYVIYLLFLFFDFIKQKTIQKAEQDFGQKHLQNITRMETKSLNYNELRMKLKMELPYTLKSSDNIIDIMAVQRVAKQIVEKIINYRETYRSEPNSEYKKEYFYGARFAENERNKLAEELAKTVPNKTNGEKIVFNQKLEHLSVINSSLSDKSSEFYVAESQEKVMAKFMEKTEKITALTKEYIAVGSSKI